MPQFIRPTINKFVLPPLAEFVVKLGDHALAFVYWRQKYFIDESQSDPISEIKGIVDGMCENEKFADICASGEAQSRMTKVNMLPGLVQMQCSMMGAWGKATKDGNLVQYRSLDFGGGPFANNNILTVHHPTDSNNVFASVSWPGFVGAVTGFSEKISQSEKSAKPIYPHGTYKGLADAFVIRNMIQFADTPEDAVQMAKSVTRTWPVWIGIGDYNNQFIPMLYEDKVIEAFDEDSLAQLLSK